MPAQDDIQRSDEAFAKAVTLHQAGDVIGAIDWYQRALTISPDCGDAMSKSAPPTSGSASTATRSARDQAALKLDPSSSAVRLNLALAYYKSARPQPAIAQLKQVRCL